MWRLHVGCATWIEKGRGHTRAGVHRTRLAWPKIATTAAHPETDHAIRLGLRTHGVTKVRRFSNSAVGMRVAEVSVLTSRNVDLTMDSQPRRSARQ